MGSLKFDDETYEYRNDEKGISFSEDGSHVYLLDYISADMFLISDLLYKYCSAKINMETFELITNDDGNDGDEVDKGDNELAQIKNILESAHPYYKYEFDRTIANAIGEYFNELLIYSIYHCHNWVLKQKVNEKWYKEILWELMPQKTPPSENEKGPDDFFSEYQKRIGMRNIPDDEWETFVYDIPNKKPVPFLLEAHAQYEIANMLYFILDVDAKHINRLSIQQRVWLYKSIFGSGLNIAESLPFDEQDIPASGKDDSQQEEREELQNKIKTLGSSLEGINVVHYGITEKMQEQIASIVNLAKKITQYRKNKVYEIDNLRQLLFIEILNMIQNDVKVRVCKNCKKYFVVSNLNAKYCDRLYTSGRKCSEIGSNNTFKKKMAEDEIYTIYNRAYKTHYARQRRGKMKSVEFLEWNNEAMEKRDKVRAGEYDLEEFREWLKK